MLKENVLANEFCYPVIKCDNEGTKHILYQENFGSYSDVIYGTISDTITFNTLTSGKYGVMDMTLKNPNDRGFNGLYIILTGVNNCYLIEQINYNQMESELYKGRNYQIDVIPVENVSFSNKNIYIESDNLDTPRITCPLNENYMYIFKLDGDLQMQYFIADKMQMIPKQELICAMYNDSKFCTSKYSAIKDTFTDYLYNSDIIDTPDFYYDDQYVYAISFKNGEFQTNKVNYQDIKDKNNYIDDTWISNVNTLTDGEYSFTVWTDGDVFNYPKICLQINDLVSDITKIANNPKSVEITKIELEDLILKIYINDDVIDFDITTRTKLNWEE